MGVDMQRAPSIGSRLHATGECKPCLYVNTQGGCLKAENCDFCHMEHSKKSQRPRPCKAIRQRCKEIVSMLEDSTLATNPEVMLQAAETLGARNPYMRTLLIGKCRQLEDELAAQGSRVDSPGQGASVNAPSSEGE